jgi:hypothetical protein
MIVHVRITRLLALTAFPLSAIAQQPRPQTVFSPGQTGSVVVRIAVVQPDYSVKTLPLVPVIARRTDRADSVSGRTDLDGRVTLTLPVGAYTLNAFTPRPIAGRSYMWAVPVVIRASMTESVQLTNGNASVDSTAVAQAPTASTEAPVLPTASVTVGEPSTRTIAVQRAPAMRANTSGFFLGLALNGSAISYENSDSGVESGGGLAAQLGWGFTKNFAILLDVAGAAITSDGGDYGLAHVDISGRWHFVSPSRALVPFLEVGYAARAAVENDVVIVDDFGNSLSGDVSLVGSGVSFGGGLQYHVTPTFALGGSLKWTVGSFSTVKLDDVSVDGLDIKATSTRFNLGFTWYPVQRADR